MEKGGLMQDLSCYVAKPGLELIILPPLESRDMGLLAKQRAKPNEAKSKPSSMRGRAAPPLFVSRMAPPSQFPPEISIGKRLKSKLPLFGVFSGRPPFLG